MLCHGHRLPGSVLIAVRKCAIVDIFLVPTSLCMLVWMWLKCFNTRHTFLVMGNERTDIATTPTLAQEPAWHSKMGRTEAQVYGANFQHGEAQEHVGKTHSSP